MGLGQGLPVAPLDRLANFSAAEFERFTLEWASDYLAVKVPSIVEVQQRGGAGDKGRDVIAWLDPNTAPVRRWSLLPVQALWFGPGGRNGRSGNRERFSFTAIAETTGFRSNTNFVTHKGVTSPFQDLLDEPEKLRQYVIDNWDKYINGKIRKEPVDLTPELKKHVEYVPFTAFRAKQPLDLINEHAQTRYHLTVFGLPLIERPKPPQPPSEVSPGENEYVTQLLAVISADLGISVSTLTDFVHSEKHRRLFDRSRLTFYHAEGLKELARDQMADEGFFDTLLGEFVDGLYHWHTGEPDGYERLISTIKASQALQLSKHVLEPHVLPNDREGMCHQMANEGRVNWCNP